MFFPVCGSPNHRMRVLYAALTAIPSFVPIPRKSAIGWKQLRRAGAET